MRKFVSIGLVMMFTASGAPSTALGAAQQSGPQTATLSGAALRTDLQPLPNTKVQIRNIFTGALVASAITGQAGEYVFTNLEPGVYIVEIVDGSSRVVGMTSPFTLAPGASGSMSAVAVASTPETNPTRGFRLMGLGPAASMAVLGAAGAAAVTAVVTTRPDASPSR